MSKQRNPSIRAVAERAGVSVATVSNVLNRKSSVSPRFAARVLAAVRELGYVVDINASRLRSGRTALVGVVVPDLTNPMFAQFVSTLERTARADGYDLVVVSGRNDPDEEADRLSNLRSWRPAGLIVIPCDGGLRSRLPANHAVPTIVADRIPDDAGFDLIAVDNEPAAGAVARHLAAGGYRSCLVAGTSLSISNVRERWDGARHAARAMCAEMVEVGIGEAANFEALEARLCGADRPDALFALDHATALSAYRLVERLALRIPYDVAFASFDEMEWMRLVSPGVTAVVQPVERMARSAWTLLARRIEDHGCAPVVQRLACAIEIRGSTRRREAARRSAAA